MRWWVKTLRESRRLRAESGFYEVDQRWDQIQDAVSDIVTEILATPVAGIEGLRIKLAVLKLVKRQMYGRAKLDLLTARLLGTA